VEWGRWAYHLDNITLPSRLRNYLLQTFRLPPHDISTKRKSVQSGYQLEGGPFSSPNLPTLLALVIVPRTLFRFVAQRSRAELYLAE